MTTIEKTFLICYDDENGQARFLVRSRGKLEYSKLEENALRFTEKEAFQFIADTNAYEIEKDGDPTVLYCCEEFLM